MSKALRSTCCIKQCSAQQEENPSLTYHRFPTKKILKSKWLYILGEQNVKEGLIKPVVCSQHFDASSFERRMLRIRLKRFAMPLPIEDFLQQKGPLGFCHICLENSVRVHDIDKELSSFYEYICHFKNEKNYKFCSTCITKLRQGYAFKKECTLAIEKLKTSYEQRKVWNSEGPMMTLVSKNTTDKPESESNKTTTTNSDTAKENIELPKNNADPPKKNILNYTLLNKHISDVKNTPEDTFLLKFDDSMQEICVLKNGAQEMMEESDESTESEEESDSEEENDTTQEINDNTQDINAENDPEPVTLLKNDIKQEEDDIPQDIISENDSAQDISENDIKQEIHDENYAEPEIILDKHMTENDHLDPLGEYFDSKELIDSKLDNDISLDESIPKQKKIK